MERIKHTHAHPTARAAVGLGPALTWKDHAPSPRSAPIKNPGRRSWRGPLSLPRWGNQGPPPKMTASESPGEGAQSGDTWILGLLTSRAINY